MIDAIGFKSWAGTVEVATPVGKIDILGNAPVASVVGTTWSYSVGVALDPPAEHPVNPA